MHGSPIISFGIALVLAAPIAGGAQRIRGVVRDTGAGIALPGAVVSVVDSAGGATGRTIADFAGRFTLVRQPTSARIRVIRIGYGPRELAIPPSQGNVDLDVAMVRIPPVLDAVRVTDRELCPGSTDRGAAFQLWEQVRAGLLGQIVANDAGAAMARAVMFRRRVAPTDHLVRSQTVEMRSGRSIRPFVAAATAATLAKVGYIEEDGGGRTFRAPDSDVLLHESFAATHCFHLRTADAGHPGEVGLAFTPVPGRDSLVDISGVVWIDQTIRELRSFDFLYTSLEPAAMRAEVGGRMRFRTATNGVSFIERWTMWLPILTATGMLTPPTRTTRRNDRTDLRVSEVQETGGVMLDAAWDDGTRWTAPTTGLAGVATESKTRSPIAGAIVTLDGMTEHAVADSRGAFSLTPIVPGRYTATVSDTSLSAFASPRHASQVVDVVPGEIAAIRPVSLSAADAVGDACKQRKRAATEPIVIGQVQIAGGASVAGAGLNAAWGPDAGGDSTVKLDLDTRGRFLLCSAPNGEPIRLRLVATRRQADTTILAGASAVTSIEWRPTFSAVSVAQQRVIRGVITDTAHRPLRGVNVNLVGGRSTVTDDSGRFRLQLTSREELALDIRRLGFTPSLYILGEGGDTTLVVTLLPLAQQLAAVEVRDRAPGPASLSGFDERMRAREKGASAGYFITSAEIERRQGSRATSLFDNVPGIFVLRVGNHGNYSIFGRGRVIPDGSVPNADKCAATVFVDGVRIQEGGDALSGPPGSKGAALERGVPIDQLVSPSDIAAIEVYASGNTAPPGYQLLNGSCAVVLIWTKRGG